MSEKGDCSERAQNFLDLFGLGNAATAAFVLGEVAEALINSGGSEKEFAHRLLDAAQAMNAACRSHQGTG